MIEDDEQETIQSVKQPDYFNPDVNKIQQAVPLMMPSAHSYDDMSYVQKITSENQEAPGVELKPLNFSVDENFFNLEPDEYSDSKSNTTNKFIEKRGLLLYVKERPTGGVVPLQWYRPTHSAHLEFQFPAAKGFSPSHCDKKEWQERSDLARTAILFWDMESVAFINNPSSKAKLIIKLKPERKAHRLAIDIVERDVVLLISQENVEQAEQFLAIIQMEIARENERKRKYEKKREEEAAKLKEERAIQRTKLKQEEAMKKSFLGKLKFYLNKLRQL